MGQALYRKYRSKTFDEVIGQEHVTKTLQNAIKAGRVSHAYLFTGPRGVGKTSVARILAHEVNQLPYEDESTHLDIIEIDAASNRRIDEIRDLREKVHTAPTSAKYKVYIIDEVHMLTREAFNALLKTLEEPPAHCIFVLATTEAHKLPETIISRTQRFNFKPVAGDSAVRHLESIAKREKLDIEQEALELIAEHGEGSFRDSIGILDQLRATGKQITFDDARRFLGLAPGESVEKLAGAISGGNSRIILETLDELKYQGTSASKVARQLSADLRQRLVDGDNSPWLPKLLKQLLAVDASPSPYDFLEISLLETAAENSPKTPQQEKQVMDIKAPEPAAEVKTVQLKAEKTETTAEPPATQAKKEPKSGKFSLQDWPGIVARVKKDAASLYTALRLASPSLDGDELTLAFQFPLHQKKVSQAKNLDIIGQAIEELTGAKLSITCVVDKSAAPPEPAIAPPKMSPAVQPAEPAAPISAISNIFGGAEVLES